MIKRICPRPALHCLVCAHLRTRGQPKFVLQAALEALGKKRHYWRQSEHSPHLSAGRPRVLVLVAESCCCDMTTVVCRGFYLGQPLAVAAMCSIRPGDGVMNTTMRDWQCISTGPNDSGTLGARLDSSDYIRWQYVPTRYVKWELHRLPQPATMLLFRNYRNFFFR